MDIIRIHEYRDLDGRTVFEVVRLGKPKSFRQRARYGDGWRWGKQAGWYRYRGSDLYRIESATDPNVQPEPDAVWLPKIPDIPYNLPDLARAKETGETVYLTEGEHDADVGKKMGFTTSTNPKGAGKFTSDLAFYFIGCREIILVRHKDEAGHKHVQATAETLHEADPNITIRIIQVPDTFRSAGGLV